MGRKRILSAQKSGQRGGERRGGQRSCNETTSCDCCRGWFRGTRDGEMRREAEHGGQGRIGNGRRGGEEGSRRFPPARTCTIGSAYRPAQMHVRGMSASRC